MKPIIIYNSKITKYFNLDGLVLYPFIFISECKENTSLTTLKHEFIHIEQINRHGIFQFYYRYPVLKNHLSMIFFEYFLLEFY